MHELTPQNVQCPYCGETIEVLIDGSIPQQEYIEDCQVCCCPINFNVCVDQGKFISVEVSHENE